jgi:hypothetical protein
MTLLAESLDGRLEAGQWIGSLAVLLKLMLDAVKLRAKAPANRQATGAGEVASILSASHRHSKNHKDYKN